MQTEDKLIPYGATDLTGKRVLVLAPHPDDETIGCGGSLAQHARAEDPIKVLFLTDGAAGDRSAKQHRDDYVGLRRKEARRACHALGVTDVEFWPYSDRELAGSRGALNRLIGVLNTYQPELIYAPSALELHPDHRAAAYLLADALRTSGLHAEVAFYEISHPIGVNVLVDISPVLEQKRKALSEYASQLAEQPYDAQCLGLNRFRSMTLPGHVSHAEGFSMWTSDLIGRIHLADLPFRTQARWLPAPGQAGPLVSVIVRTMDRPETLAAALNSIAAQSYANIEVVLVNDGQTEVDELAARLLGDIPLHYICDERGRGRAGAANRGLEAARGVYLNFLDDDDVLYCDHIASLVNILESTGSKVAYSGVKNAYFTGPPHQPGNQINEEIIFNIDFDSDLLLFENYIPLMSVMFSRETIAGGDRFYEKLDIFEDWDFWIRLSRRHAFYHLDKITAEYRFYGVASVEESHRQKYRLDEARKLIFDRNYKYLTSEAWKRFLEKGPISRLEKDNKYLNRTVAELRRDLDGYKKHIDDLEAVIGNFQEKERRLVEQEKHIARLVEAIENLRGVEKQVETLEATVSAKERQTAELQQERDNWISTHSELTEQYRQARAELDGIRSRLAFRAYKRARKLFGAAR